MIDKKHVKGFVAAVLALVTYFGGSKVVRFVKVVQTVEALTEVVAEDQKSGQKFTVVDVLEQVAAEKIQAIQAQQKAQSQPSK